MRTSARAVFATGMAAIGMVAGVGGTFVVGDIREVPVDRIVRNLNARLAARPDDPQLLARLARVHAMAYALKASELSVDTRTLEPGPPTEHNSPADRVVPASTGAAQRLAARHLAAALKYYRLALDRAPDDPVVRLGYAWCLDRDGRKAEAIDEYRRVIARAWQEDQRIEHVGPGAEPVSAEAIDYLLKLLDPGRDAAEIQTLQDRRRHLASLPRMVTPLAIPLRDDVGFGELTDGSSVSFDADGSGAIRDWTWITPDFGWLVWDPTGAGQIRSGLQLFGNVTFWLFWPTGYDALCALDDDGDGELTAEELSGLAIWRDVNQDGISEPGEVEPLSRLGIARLSCEHDRVFGVSSVAAFSRRGVVFRDGRARATYDVWLRSPSP